MSLDSGVVQELLKTGAAQAEFKTIEGNPVAVLHKDFAVVDLERYLSVPVRKRGNANLMDLDSFTKYVLEHQSIQTRIYGTKGNQPSFKAILDDHAELPGWRQHTASYKFPLSKQWLAWTGSNGKAMSQEEFAEFIENYALDIVNPATAEMIEIARTFQAKTSVDFAKATRLQNGQVQFKYQENIDAKAGENGQFEVPEKFTIAIQVFEGTDKFKIEARLRYRLKGPSLTLWYDLERPDLVIDTVTDEIWKKLSETVTAPIYHGSV